MTAVTDQPRSLECMRAQAREPLHMVFTLVGREIRDTLRDWRIVVPIVILTVFFPILMSFVADLALSWVARYGDPVIGERLIPFLLLVVGFFPISFSLVIALETFVGEKERRSLEPLLATPLTDAQLYLGKTLAAMIPPLLAAYLGIEEIKDKQLAAKEGTWDTGTAGAEVQDSATEAEVDKYKAEVEELKAKLADLEKKDTPENSQ